MSGPQAPSGFHAPAFKADGARGPEVSVVVCTRNRAAYLARALESLKGQSLPAEIFEILVVDNASSDDTRAQVERAARAQSNLVYLHEPALGLSQARNTGWRSAGTPLVAFLDDDAVAHPDWIEKMLRAFRKAEPAADCVGGRIEPIWEAPRPAWLTDELTAPLTVLLWDRPPGPLEAGRWVAGANMAFTRHILEELGGFSTGLGRKGNNLLSNEEVLMQEAIRRRGGTVWYDPAVVVGHHVPAARMTRAFMRRRYWWQGISQAATRRRLEPVPSGKRAAKALRYALGLLKPGRFAGLVFPFLGRRGFVRKCLALERAGLAYGMLIPGPSGNREDMGEDVS